MAVGAARGTILKPAGTSGWQTIAVSNPSFESPVVAEEDFSQLPTDWNIAIGNSAVAFRPSAAQISQGAHAGSQTLLIHSPSISTIIVQSITIPIEIGDTFRLSVYTCLRDDQPLAHAIRIYLSLGAPLQFGVLDFTESNYGSWTLRQVEITADRTSSTIAVNLSKNTSADSTHQIAFDSVLLEKKL